MATNEQIDSSIDKKVAEDVNNLAIDGSKTQDKVSSAGDSEQIDITDALDKKDSEKPAIDIAQVKATIKAVDIDDKQAEKLGQIIAAIPAILAKIDNKSYDEIFGYRINIDTEEHVDVPIRNEILLKFLIANEYDVSITKQKLINSLNWRNKFQPLSAAYDETYEAELNDLGVLTKFENGNNNLKVVTWNLYGNLKSLKKLFEKFGDSTSKKPGSQFLRWRIGLMERSLAFIDFKDPLNHKTGQVHDYTNASLFRMDSGMKANTKEIVEIFGANYPELLSVKYFIGIPAIMSWVFGFIKSIGLISKETLKKFQVFSGTDMSSHFGKDNIPITYGGTIDSSILDLEVKQVDPPAYATIIIQKFNEEEIKDIIDTVE